MFGSSKELFRQKILEQVPHQISKERAEQMIADFDKQCADSNAIITGSILSFGLQVVAVILLLMSVGYLWIGLDSLRLAGARKPVLIMIGGSAVGIVLSCVAFVSAGKMRKRMAAAATGIYDKAIAEVLRPR